MRRFRTAVPMGERDSVGFSRLRMGALRLTCGALGLAAACSWLGCAPDSGTDSGDDPGAGIREPDQELGSSEQRLWSTWGPIDGFTPLIVGMSRAPSSGSNKPYAWYSDGWVCRGQAQADDVCGEAVYQYIAPDNFSNIVGVGIAKNTSHTFAWYTDNTVSQGTSDNLSQYAGKRTFSRPPKPGGGLFAMTDMVDADNDDVTGHWYFWWKLGSTVYRTIGSSENGSQFSGAQQVSWSQSDGDIMGISILEGRGYKTETWYASGWKDKSNDWGTLAQ